MRPDVPQLHVLSLNCRKQPEVMHSLINSTPPSCWDILCLQELPYDIDKRSGYYTKYWVPIFPSYASMRSNTEHIRSIMLINSSLPSDSYTAISITSLDLTGITLTTSNHSLNIYSVYNPPDSDSTIHILYSHLSSLLVSTNILLTGDFNKHDPLWTGALYPDRTTCSDTTLILQTLATHHLLPCLPPATPTFYSDAHKTWSTLDLVFATENIADAIIKCETDSGHSSDHLAVCTTLDLDIAQFNPEPCPQFREADWKGFNKNMGSCLQQDPLPTSFDTRKDLDRGVDRMTQVFQEEIAKVLPKTKLCPYSKHWWSRELSDLRKKFVKAACKVHKKNAPYEAAEEALKARQEYHAAIRKQKKWHWQNFVENADERSIWLANKYVSKPSGNLGATRIPPLQHANGVAQSTEEKSQVLLETFFPPPPPADTGDITDFDYPESVPHSQITTQDIMQAIADLNPFKAPGPKAISNAAIKHAAELIEPTLTAMANTSITLGYHPSEWHVFTTITLRKPGKDDYTIPKAYRPIALEDTISKVIESVIARHLATLAEEFGLLADHNFGGRPGRTTMDAVLLVVQRIKDAWRTKSIVSALFLDISQAFPTVSHGRLLHNLRKRCIPEPLVKWLESFLTDH